MFMLGGLIFVPLFFAPLAIISAAIYMILDELDIPNKVGMAPAWWEAIFIWGILVFKWTYFPNDSKKNIARTD